MNKRAYIALRAVILPSLIATMGSYLHWQDVRTHNAVDGAPVANTATITRVEDTKLAGTYLIVQFTDNQDRQDETHIWYGWTTKKFSTGEPLQIYYDSNNPLKAYAAERGTAESLRTLEIATPVVYILSIVAASGILFVTRRRKRVVALASTHPAVVQQHQSYEQQDYAQRYQESLRIQAEFQRQQSQAQPPPGPPSQV